ncbi:MAG TPA: hypothetical protein VFB36_04060 [Nevskiaceae bacterium]|nr:hypothetical protein [Nevskiaceae bacterium]
MRSVERTALRVGAFRRIYDPSIGEAERWYINDHTFIRGADGTWHLFGITHAEPFAPLDEKFFAHATAPSLHGPWTKQAPILHAEPACGETHVWAPHVIHHDDRYWMFYCGGGDANTRYRIHLATSTDLWAWQRHPDNPMLIDGFDARDPMVMRFEDGWILYYTATSKPEGGHHVVNAMFSDDLVRWSGKREVFRSSVIGTYGGPTESPFVVAHAGRYFLFVCTNRNYNETAVYVSDSPLHWQEQALVTTFPSHAAEVVVDEAGVWFASRCGWGQGGVYLAPLDWNPPR